MIKLVGRVRLKALTTDTRLKLTLFSDIESQVEGYEYVCPYIIRYVYPELILRYNLILMKIFKKNKVTANTFSDKGEGG